MRQDQPGRTPRLKGDAALLLGVGLYEPFEAARLLGLVSGTVRRWVGGYRYTVGGTARRESSRVMPPVIAATFPGPGKLLAVSFLDLVELLAVREFLRHGVSLREIRLAHRDARGVYQNDHPFAFHRFRTGGKRVFAALLAGDGLVQLGRGPQYVFREFVEQHLRHVDFDVDSGFARRWWPLGRGKIVVVDPEVSFGAPVVHGTGIRATVLYDSYKAEGSIGRTARWFGLSQEQVQAAVDFEQSRKVA